MPKDIQLMIDEIALSDLLLSRNVRLHAGSACNATKSKLTEMRNSHYRRIAELRDKGGDAAMNLLMQRIGETRV